MTHRSNPADPFTTAEVANAIGSRRLAPSAIAEVTNAGLVHVIGHHLTPSQLILESTQLRGFATAGQVSSDSPARSANPLLAASAGSLEPSKQHAQLGVRTAAKVCVPGDDVSSRRGEAIMCAARDSKHSIPEGNTYAQESGHHGIKNNKNNILTPEKIQSRARTRSETRASDRQAMAKEQARRILASHNTVSISLVGETNSAKAYGMAIAYEEALGVYTHRPTLKFIRGRVGPGAPNFDTWVRAATFADELGVDYATYVKAQFWAFDRWYSRAPKPYELASFKSEKSARDRVVMYLEALNAGEVAADSQVLSKERAVVDTTTESAKRREAVKVAKDVRFRHSHAQLQQLMRNYCLTEEQVLRTFAKGQSALLYFDREWLKENATYQRLLAAGEI